MNVCRDCQERHIGCHSRCERYLEAVKQNEVVKRNRELYDIGDYLNMKRRLEVGIKRAKLIKSGHKLKGGRKP